MNILNIDQQATLLLTAQLGNSKSTAKPLTPTEWGRFDFWLNEQELQPGELLTGRLADKLEGWDDKKISAERIEILLDQGLALALAVERWERAGIWIVSRSDTNYPQRLKEKLDKHAPAVLYGCGNRLLIDRGGVAVVGSRNASDEDLKFASSIGAQTALAGYSLVSGGARGIDESAMLGALESEGTVIGMLSCELIRNVTTKKFRQGVRDNNLLLISSVAPEIRFTVGNAMGRNKYIYCLSDVAVAVHSGKSGGTWSGAVENLKNAWVPLWVKQSLDEEAGNVELIARGGRAIPENIPGDLIEVLISPTKSEIGIPSKELPQTDAKEDSSSWEVDLLDGVGEEDASVELYESFCQVLFRSLRDGARSPKELEVMLGLTPRQLNRWLSQTVNEHRIEKTMRPVRYETTNPQDQLLEGKSLYDSFLDQLLNTVKEIPLTQAELEGVFDLTPKQAGIWLAQAIQEKQITKLSRPVRYQKAGFQREIF